jgi:hypothetical protein
VNEKQLTESMSLAALDEPPLGFDPDTVIDQVIRRRRRTVLVASSGTTAVLVAVAAVAFGGMGPQRLGPATSPAPSPPSNPLVVGDPDMSPGPCPLSMPEVVPPLLAEHFPDVEFDPVPEPYTDPKSQLWLNLLGDNQQFVDVTCRSGPTGSETHHTPKPETVIDESPEPGARLRVLVYESFENRPPQIIGKWTQGERLTLQVSVNGGDTLVATPEKVAALTTEIAEAAR